MKIIRKIESFDGVKSIIAYTVPCVGDKVVSEKGAQAYCSEILEIWHGNLFTLTDINYPEESVNVTDKHFKDGVFSVVK